jgi:5-formyltetrahydrofolate cyclo-ligase
MSGAEKSALRADLLAARRLRSDADVAAARIAICRHVLDRCARDGWQRVAGYVPLRTEPGSVELLNALTAAGVDVLAPLLLPDNDLSWQRWPDGDDLGAGAIAGVDAVLVPALAVAADGTRLGRGGGSYDRALARAAAVRTVAALLFDGELRDVVPADPWDRPVTAIVTPLGWFDLPIGNAAAHRDA